VVGHFIKEYGSVRRYRPRMRTNHSVLWVENSVTNSEKSEPECRGNKVNPSNLTFYRPLDEKTS
jgi:hypothetical protein